MVSLAGISRHTSMERFTQRCSNSALANLSLRSTFPRDAQDRIHIEERSNRAHSKRVYSRRDYRKHRMTEIEMVGTSQKGLGSSASQQLMPPQLPGSLDQKEHLAEYCLFAG